MQQGQTSSGYERITKDNKHAVKLNLFKGEHKMGHIYDKDVKIMIRIKVHFSDNLAKYVDLHKKFVKETIESVDMDLDLLQIFLNENNTPAQVSSIVHALRDTHSSVPIGEFVGSIMFPEKEFLRFIKFMKHLSYDTFNDENIL